MVRAHPRILPEASAAVYHLLSAAGAKAGLSRRASKGAEPYDCRHTEEARQALTQDRIAVEAPAARSAPARSGRARADRARRVLRVPRVLRLGRRPGRIAGRRGPALAARRRALRGAG